MKHATRSMAWQFVVLSTSVLFCILLLGSALAANSAANSGSAPPWEQPGFAADPKAVLQSANATVGDKADAVTVLLDERRIEIDDQGRTTGTARLVYRVNTAQGVEGWDRVSAGWEPWYQSRPEITARVITPDGTAHMLDPKTMTDAPARENAPSTFSDDRVYHGPLPAVAIGSVVEEITVVRDTAPFFPAGVAKRVYLGRIVPVQMSRVVLEAPATADLRHAVHMLPGATVTKEEKDGRVRITIEAGPLDAMQGEEPLLPTDLPRWPHVDYKTAKSWQTVADAYRDMVEPQIRVDEVKAQVGAVPKGGSRDSVIRAIVALLHKDVRYTGVEFGVSKLVPQSPAETLKRKYGDCKDKATLLVTMLRAAGIPAHLALLTADMGSQDAEADMPGMGLFDHAIVYVPGTPDLWIDATAEYTAVGDLPPMDQGRAALVIREGTKELTRTPEMKSADNVTVETREFFLSEFGKARVAETTDAVGELGSVLRGQYGGLIDEEARKQLEDYAKPTYAAESLTKVEAGDPNDLSKPFRLRLEVANASRGTTGEEDAAVAIFPSHLLSRLPQALRTEDEDEEEKNTEEQAKPKRTRRNDDFVLPEAFVAEWHYRIVPPPGFEAHGLPENKTMAIGPAKLTQEYRLEDKGVVAATLRFDTVKRRYTAAEAKEIRAAVKKLNESPTVMITFDLKGHALLAEGKIREALTAYKSLIALHPKEGLHRAQLASGLLQAGLGGKARVEAREATKLEPNSAFAYKTLAWILQHDLVGRRFGRGFDLEGSIAAYRKAVELDPKDSLIRADFAILLEHDATGERYTKKARLKEAVAEYFALKKNEEDNHSYDENLAYALLYAGRYEEARAFASERPSASRRAVALAATAALKSAGDAIQQSLDIGGTEDERRAALYTAGVLLMRMRMYQKAVEMMSTGAGSQTNSPQVLALIEALRKAKRIEDMGLNDGTPDGVVRLFTASVVDEGANSMLRLASKNGLDPAKTEKEQVEEIERQQRSVRMSLRATELPTAVLGDLMMSNMRTSVEGDDTLGYRVSGQAIGAKNQTLFVVKENGAYRLLGDGNDRASIGREVRARLAKGDLTGARKWLDWAREEVQMGGGDDPLAGPVFARFWTRGQEAGLDTMEYAAAALMTEDGSAKDAIAALKQGRDKASTDADRSKFGLALARAFTHTRDWAALDEVAETLVKAHPRSDVAMGALMTASRELKTWTAFNAALQERMAKMPDDVEAMRMSAHAMEMQGQFERARAVLRKMIDNGRGDAQDMNSYGWDALFVAKVTPEDIEITQRGLAMENNRNFATMHTLACLFAEIGKTKEARDLLLNAMDVANMDAPDGSVWYGFGRIAEQYGELDAAKDAYERMEKPKFDEGPTSTYALATVRMKAVEAELKKNGVAAGK